MITDKISSWLAPRIERQAAAAVRHVHAVSPSEAGGLVAEVYARLRRDFLVAPPMTLHSAVPEVLAAVACVCCEILVAGRLDRGLKEIIATGVSESNRCPYCVEVHSTSAEVLLGARAIEAARAGTDAAAQGREAAVLAWAQATRLPGSPRLASTPFDAEETAEAVATASAFHYINRMVSVFCEDSPVPRPLGLKRLQAVARAVARPIFASVAGRRTEPGSWLDILSDRGDPSSFRWASSRPTIARALAGLYAVIERKAGRVVPVPVRELVSYRLLKWTGEHPPLGKAWVNEAVGVLGESHRPAARLALLTALAAYQVENADVEEYRATGASDADIVVLTSWASLQAADRVMAWLTARTSSVRAA